MKLHRRANFVSASLDFLKCDALLSVGMGCTTGEMTAVDRYNQSLNYLQGHGCSKDESRAFVLNTEAAQLGDSDAILAMGWFYLNGVGVERNVERARKWYRDSARRGDARAMFSLGQIAHDEGENSEALVWFRRASEAGHYRSDYFIGKHYWRGHGVDQDKKEAMRYFHRAANHKVKAAQRVLRFLTRNA